MSIGWYCRHGNCSNRGHNIAKLKIWKQKNCKQKQSTTNQKSKQIADLPILPKVPGWFHPVQQPKWVEGRALHPKCWGDISSRGNKK